jgi:hypothetical protein
VEIVATFRDCMQAWNTRKYPEFAAHGDLRGL